MFIVTRCIASSFYIKPQRRQLKLPTRRVVLHPLSTSNHNCFIEIGFFVKLYCILFLHQTTTPSSDAVSPSSLYCILFLHQTTTTSYSNNTHPCCIASSFYIKPQLAALQNSPASCCIASSFYIKPQRYQPRLNASNSCIASSFYIKPQQRHVTKRRNACCIASSFYIKPQPRTPDTLIFGHLTASRHDTKRGGVHRGSRFDAVFTFSTNIRKIIFTEIRRCMSVQRAGARLRSDSSEANI